MAVEWFLGTAHDSSKRVDYKGYLQNVASIL